MVRTGRPRKHGSFTIKTVKQLYDTWVGKKGMLCVLDIPAEQGSSVEFSPGMLIPVHINDARGLFGREDLLVQPCFGSGSVWVGAVKVKVVEDWPHETKTFTASSGANESPSLDSGDSDALA